MPLHQADRKTIRLRFLYLTFSLLWSATGSPPTYAAQITLSSDQIGKRIAIPWELRLQFSAISDTDREKALKSFSKSQAQLECLAHTCGTAPCTHVVQHEYVSKEAQPDAQLRIASDSPQGSTLSTRPWAFSIADEKIYEDYFESITCSDGPPPEDLTDVVQDVVRTCNTVNSGLSTASSACTSANAGNTSSHSESSPSQKRKREEEESTSYSQAFKKLKSKAPSLKRVSNYGFDCLCLAWAVGIKGAIEYFSDGNSMAAAMDSAWVNMCKRAFKATGLPEMVSKKLDTYIERKRDEIAPEFLLDKAAKERLTAEKEVKALKEKLLKAENDHKILPENKIYLESELESVTKGLQYLKNRDAFRGMINFPTSIEELNSAIVRLGKVISLPQEVKKVDFRDAEPILETLTQNIDPELANQIKRIGKTIEAGSKDGNRSKTIYYLKGHPGTGKTFLAKGIAEAFGLPFLETKITGVDQRGKDPMSEEIDKFLANNTAKNSVIFIDEAGDFLRTAGHDTNPFTAVLLTKFKILLDPDNGKLEALSLEDSSRSYNATSKPYHDISKVTFILTGNYEITEKALSSRMQTIRFPKIDEAHRKQIAQIIWKKVTRNELTDENQKVLDEIVTKTAKQFDGVREMEQLIRNYFVEYLHNPKTAYNVDDELKTFENATTQPSTSSKDSSEEN